ncbi:MAG TPA: glutamate--tRNA ligase [Firmicutes bacterium]|jgi:glutamyl-tRNA synthetase|nr:glutamate--tRNA ligase [Bacillota bacterium]
MSSVTPRLRFSPSPTGYLHIGSARSALYNYLLAKSMGGQFLLRIEDTDRKRLVPDSLDDIINSLHALGIQWDEGPDIGGPYGPYAQSERLPIYHKHLHQLVEQGKAYPCFCTQERLEQVRKEQEAAKTDIMYDRHCRSIDPQEAKRRMESEPYVIRFKMPETGTTQVEDVLRGVLTFDNSKLDDHVLLKRKVAGEAYAWPTYHGCSPIDDHLMRITHIVRGEEWLPSTPRHKLMFQAFGWDVPVFCHLPVILSATGKGKMSKRDGDTAVRDFLRHGYLPAALVNFVLLLGWSGKNDQDLYTMEEAAKVFSFAGLSKSPAAFQTDKLEWFNGVYIRNLSVAELAQQLLPYMQEAGYVSAKPTAAEINYLHSIVPLIQERMTVLTDAVEQVDFLYGDVQDYEPALLLQAKVSPAQARQVIDAALHVVDTATDFTGEALHDALKTAADKLGLKARQVFMPLRVALSGRTVSPGSTTDIMAVLGPEETQKRLRMAQQKAAALG